VPTVMLWEPGFYSEGCFIVAGVAHLDRHVTLECQALAPQNGERIHRRDFL
jgi:hypothetical protein